MADDFKTINMSYWNIVDAGNNPNNELQYYSKNNIQTNNGYLNIIAKKELFNNHNYTSGAINTKGKYEFQYGKIIFKTKTVLGDGLFPAIWLLPSDNDRYPEVDLIEILGEKPSELWIGMHYINNNKKEAYFTNYYVDNDYFTYEFIWSKDIIECYINNNLVYKTTENIPQEKMYLIINLAVGGNWPTDVDDNDLPSSFLIDYIIVIPEE